jgi:ABC-type sulfate/molybdate transport systems ATPase subunit
VIELAIRRRLRSFTLDVAARFPAGVTVVAGPSGAGKTTLLRAIAGLDPPDTGRIVLDGEVLDDGRRHVPAFRREIAYVFQEYALFPHLDVAANVGYGLAARGVAPARRTALIADWLERLGIAPLAAARPGALSGGERQRVALARALAWSPRAVLLDEPFSALDDATRGGVRDAVRATLAGLDVPVLLVTHDEEDVAEFAAPVLRLAEGKENGAVHRVSVRTAP